MPSIVFKVCFHRVFGVRGFKNFFQTFSRCVGKCTHFIYTYSSYFRTYYRKRFAGYAFAPSCQRGRQICLLVLSSSLAGQHFSPPFRTKANLESLTMVSFKIAEVEDIKIDLILSLKAANAGKGHFLHCFLFASNDLGSKL